MNPHPVKNSASDDSASVASKRRFLRQMVGGTLLALGGSGMASAAVNHIYPYPKAKMLALENPITGDTLRLTYFDQGRYLKGALHEINYLLRDFHSDTVHPIDLALVDQLYDLKQLLGINKPIHVISGYRSPDTNALLRQHSHRVAKHSLHMEGRAIDIRVEGIPTKTLKNAALALARGGVGYYPHANFVHLDTGDVRAW